MDSNVFIHTLSLQIADEEFTEMIHLKQNI